MFGRTEQLDAAHVAKLHPTHDAFVRKFAAVEEIVRLGYWLLTEGDLAPGAVGRQIGV